MKTSNTDAGFRKKNAVKEIVASTIATYHPLINNAVLKATAKTIASIDKVLLGERTLSVSLGELLGKLKNEIAAHLKKSGVRVSDFQVRTAFHNFVQIRFKIGESRTKEYIRLAEREDLHRMGLPTSVLIELSRLEPDALKNFKKKHTTAELKKLPFKEIKKLIRGDNANKRASAKAESKTSPQAIAETLKNTFEIVRDNFEDKSALDKEVDSVLGEISKWYFDKKVA